MPNQSSNNLDQDRIKFSIEALFNLIKMINLSYSRLVDLLGEYDKSDHEEVSMQAWLVVGNLNRLRALLGGISGIKKNLPWFQLFIREIADAEVMRHIVEHYDSNLQKLITEVKPLLGHISWMEYKNPKQVVVTMGLPGTLRKFKGLGVVNPAGKTIRAKIDHITYYLDGDELDLSDLYYSLEGFTQSLEDYQSSKKV